MSEMVERVAKAMWQSEWDRAKANERAANEAAGRPVYVCYVPKWEDCNLIFLDYARSAVSAMRELPDSLYDDGGALDPNIIGYDRSAETYWEAIIDAALTSPRT